MSIVISLESEKMNTSRARHVLNSLTIISFLIFGGLSALILLLNVPLTNMTVSLPFAFLFISTMTLITTGRISDQPGLIEKYLLEWLFICVFITLVCALVFLLG